ncbi:MAG: SAM-dependent methyltransferase [Thiohalocapsa sp.]
MKPNKPSATADGAAFIRCVQQGLPGEDRILEDPFACDMAGGWFRRLIAQTALSRRLLARKLGADIIDHVPARDRYAQEWAERAAEEGARQLLLLGVGYDTMSYRLARRRVGFRIFEVDHPATQVQKRARVGRLEREATLDLTDVEVDFEHDSLIGRLEQAGFDPAVPTLCCWIGVIYYLSESAVRATLADLKALLSANSLLVLEFWPDQKNASGRRPTDQQAWFQKMGEPLQFGVEPSEMKDLLASYALDLFDVRTTNELIRDYVGRDWTETQPMYMGVARRREASASAP